MKMSEIAVVFSLQAENLSYINILDALLIFPMAMLWAIIPSDGIAIITSWFFDKVATITLALPFSRQMEAEADEVGLKLSAKACFDVREAPAFWGKMHLLEQLADEDLAELQGTLEFLQTHPSHESRAKKLTSLLPQALEIRNECNCYKLPAIDPLAIFRIIEKELKEEAALAKKEKEAKAKGSFVEIKV